MKTVNLNKDNEISKNSNIEGVDYKPEKPLNNSDNSLFESKPTQTIHEKSCGCIAVLLIIPILVVGISAYFFFNDQRSEDKKMTFITTPTGVAEVPSKKLEEFFNAVNDEDAAAMNSILNEYPAIIYEQEAIYPELDRVILHSSPEMVQVMLDQGAKIDDRFQYESREFKEYSFQYSLENYFKRHEIISDGSKELQMVEFLIDNGALTEYGYSEDGWKRINSYGDTVGYHQPNALFSAAAWICEDGAFTQTDKKLIELLIDSGIDTKIKNQYGETVKEYFEKNIESNDIPTKDINEYDEIVKLLDQGGNM